MRLKLLARREGCCAALILLLILNVLFFPFLWGQRSMLDSAQLCPSVLSRGSWSGKPAYLRWSKTLDGAAAAWFFEPSLALTGHEYLRDKTIPLWNPYQAYGAPFAANMQSQPFYPLTMLLSLHVTPYTYNLFILSRLFITGIFAFFYLRIFVSFIPALTGAIAAMLGGYYIFFMTMPHLSVEILIPAALFGAERLLRTRTYGSFLAFVAVLFLVIVGGMPESSLLLLVFTYLYMAFRVITDPDLRSLWISLTVRVILASVAGLCLSSILLLPFLEFMRHSYNTHDPKLLGGAIPGLVHLAPNSTVFTFLFPLICGQLIYGSSYGLQNQFGLVAFFLTLVAVMAAFRRQGTGAASHLRSLTWFFFAYTAILLLKHYGIGPINDLGKLPFFRYVLFYKYGEAELSVCIAALCAIGVERLMSSQVSKLSLGIALVVSLAMAPLAYHMCRPTMLAELALKHTRIQFTEIALLSAVSAIVCVAVSLIAFRRLPRILAISVAAILTLELSFNYIVPIYYIYNSLPTRSQNPYEGAPYIRFLRMKTLDYERSFARYSLLYPDWASVFELQDIRDLDAIYYSKYLAFVRNFVTPGPQGKTHELWDRFTGDMADYAFGTPKEKRLLQLSSTKFLLTPKPYSDPAFRPIYNNEVQIYEYDDVLPRASLYYRAEIEANETEVLKKLADPGFNIFETALLDRTKLTPFQFEAVARLNQGPAKGVTAARITSYLPQAVEIEATLDQPAILVLNDSDYPGWAVEIDGDGGKWFTTNYLFRGVFLPAGKHAVRFLYRPRVFYEGLSLAVLTLLVLGVSGVVSPGARNARVSITRRRDRFFAFARSGRLGKAG
jgi:hypothetical protein